MIAQYNDSNFIFFMFLKSLKRKLYLLLIKEVPSMQSKQHGKLLCF